MAPLGRAEKVALLGLARRTLDEFVSKGRVADYDSSSAPDALRDPGQAFVTLHEGKELRGCVGSVDSSRALWKAVQDMTVESASRDTRFDAIRPQQLGEISIEISVLGLHLPVRNPSQVQPGRHGLLVRRGGNQGLLLPQVAPRYGWDAVEFMNQTCKKAGLPPAAWREAQTQVFSFEAEIFSARPPMTVYFAGTLAATARQVALSLGAGWMRPLEGVPFGEVDLLISLGEATASAPVRSRRHVAWQAKEGRDLESQISALVNEVVVARAEL
ncbi:MAG TPA: AmmeMemoRadiSam system protein A [Planctomycetota bacterium]|nr:AmmeMemoRadiSam system protein A [Planctomycetota bacterium]